MPEEFKTEIEELEKGYLGGDAEERSNLKVKEVFGKMQSQFFEGYKQGEKSKQKEMIEKIKKEDSKNYSVPESINIFKKKLIKSIGVKKMKENERVLRALCKSWQTTGLIDVEQLKYIKKDLDVFIRNHLN